MCCCDLSPSLSVSSLPASIDIFNPSMSIVYCLSFPHLRPSPSRLLLAAKKRELSINFGTFPSFPILFLPASSPVTPCQPLSSTPPLLLSLSFSRTHARTHASIYASTIKQRCTAKSRRPTAEDRLFHLSRVLPLELLLLACEGGTAGMLKDSSCLLK